MTHSPGFGRSLNATVREPHVGEECHQKFSVLTRGAVADLSIGRPSVASDSGYTAAAKYETASSLCGPVRAGGPLTPRILRLPEVVRRVGLKRSSIYGRMNPSSRQFDESFPKPVKLTSPGGPTCRRKGAVGWFESDIDKWLANLGGDRPGGED